MGGTPLLRPGAGRQRHQRRESPRLTCDVLGTCGTGRNGGMSILRVLKPFVAGGAVAAAMAVMPVAAAEANAGPASAAPTHVIFKQDPGGGGCDANGTCGSGGQFSGPGGGPGGQGC